MPATPSRLHVTAAASCLARGGVIAYPTEGVWGLVCDPFYATAVTRLMTLKGRSADKGVILVAGDVAQLDSIIDWSGLAAVRRDDVLASWPGPHTWIVPATSQVPSWITGAHASVAVRVSAHPGVAALCAAFGGSLVSTSANQSGRPAAATYAALDPELLTGIDGVLEGETGRSGQPSTIRDATTGALLRA